MLAQETVCVPSASNISKTIHLETLAVSESKTIIYFLHTDVKKKILTIEHLQASHCLVYKSPQ